MAFGTPGSLPPSDGDAGSYQRVVRSGDRMPAGGANFNIEIPWEKLIIGPDTDARRVYWCRHENAYGKTWETRNPVDRSSGLDIPPCALPALAPLARGTV